MSQPCAVQDCKRASRTLCHCCNQNLCRDHFNQHDDLLNSQLNPLKDEINALADRLKAINTTKITSNSRRQLDQWRVNCHQLIDQFYDKKCQELDRCVGESIEQQHRAINDLRSKLTKLIETQETTNKDIDSLNSTIRILGQQMTEIESNHVTIDLHPVMIDDSFIRIGQSKVDQFDLLKFPPVSGRIDGISNNFEVAANDRFLLAIINGCLCLIDEDLSIIRKTKECAIESMCWSPVLKRFLAIIQENVYTIDENTLKIKRVREIRPNNYWTCGCSNKLFYLTRNAWDSSVLEFDLLQSFQFVRRWKTIDGSERKQRIDSIVYNNETLALIVNDRSIETRMMELRSSETFSLLWSVRLDVIYYDAVIHCCSLKNNEWLLSDWRTSQLFHITNEGTVKQTSTYSPTLYNIALFRSNILVIVTEKNIIFHKL